MHFDQRLLKPKIWVGGGAMGAFDPKLMSGMELVAHYAGTSKRRCKKASFEYCRGEWGPPPNQVALDPPPPGVGYSKLKKARY